jgi:hypothetical protein
MALVTVTKGCTTSSSYGDFDSWSNIDRIFTENASYASVTLGFGVPPMEFSSHLIANTFGFAIPAGAHIQGIQVNVKCYETGGFYTVYTIDASLGKNAPSSLAGTNRYADGQFPPAANAFLTFGGPTILWGQKWNASDVNSANFGFGIMFQGDNGSNIYVDYISMTITYFLEGLFQFF